MKPYRLYAMYRGDEFVMVGTSVEIKEKLDISEPVFRTIVSAGYKKKATDKALVGYIVENSEDLI